MTLGGATERGRREPPGGVRTVPAVAARVPYVLLSTWGGGEELLFDQESSGEAVIRLWLSVQWRIREGDALM